MLMSMSFFIVGPLVHLHVGHHVHLRVGHHVSHHGGHHNVVSTLCEVKDADRMEIRKYELRMVLLMDGLTRVGASKN